MTAYPGGSANLVDILDRILDKGLVVAGDIRISLANVELLTIRIRLLVCSIDKAEQIGLNWWRYDQSLSRQEPLPALAESGSPETVARLEARIAELERQLASAQPGPASPTQTTPARASPLPEAQAQATRPLTGGRRRQVEDVQRDEPSPAPPARPRRRSR